MEQLYQDYKDLAAIYIVYISEAHAMDDPRPTGYAKELGIREHVTFSDRCTVASRLIADKKLTIPCLVDRMDAQAETAYQAWPDRIYLIARDGTLAVTGNRGPWGFRPALDAAEKWLGEYKTTGSDPAPIVLVDARAKTRKLAREMGAAYEDGNYQDALRLAEKIHELEPSDSSAAYNVACFHCLVGHEDEAYTWLERAIKAGYDDADHLLKDDDFKAIRSQDRFRGLAERIRAERAK